MQESGRDNQERPLEPLTRRDSNDETKSSPEDRTDSSTTKGDAGSLSRRAVLGRSRKLLAYSVPVIVMLVPSKAMAYSS